MKTEQEILENIEHLKKESFKEPNYHLKSYIFREIDILKWVLEN